MNTLVFDVYKNTVKKADGFNPVNAEKGYTNLLFKFKKGDDWEKCCAVTLSFFESSDDITHSQVDIKEDSLTATFRLPNAYKSLFLGITGVYIDDEGESVTVATNIIKINLIKGVIVTDSVNMDVYEKLMSYFATVRKSDLPMVDIRNFGAVADNPSVDNAEAIKKAIEFASRKRGRVYIPPATFYVDSTIPIRNKENLTIINDGVIYAKSKELRDNKFTTLFSCEQCKNLNFTVGTIKSDRDKLSKAPVNYTRKNLNGSNIIGVHINNCEDVMIDDYTADGLEYAVVINADEDGVVSKNIVLEKFKAFNTSQPIYGAHFENFSINEIYCESCPDCGLGDHFIYISRCSKNLLVNSARFVYTDTNYGVAINLRYASSSAGVDNGVLSDEYDASKDLNKAYIFDVDVENCEQFLSAKAKTKVYVENCTINSSVESSRKCLFLEEYAELYVKNSSFIFSDDNPLLSIGNNASHNVTFNNCTIKVGFLFDIGSNSATDKDVFSKNIAFLNCDIVCTSNTMSPIWLNCASEINVSFVNSKLSTNRFYTFYVGNDNIRYSIIGTEFIVDETADGLRLIYTPYDTDNTTGYSPNDNVQVINCVCRNIKRICSSQNIVDYNNLIFDKEGNVISNSGTLGKDGEDGYSPTATVTQTDIGAVITITDESGTTTARVTNGADGKDGANGTNGKDGVSCTHSWNGTTLTVTSASGTSSVNLKGDKGDTGAKGEQGIQGEKGENGSDYILTDSDKTDIARMVIESLGGEPVFGYVDENNNIIVSGKLADGTYSVKYEMEDGTTIDIGNLEFDSNVYYSVTNNLTNCTNSNSTTQEIAGNSYTATISAKSGYELSSVTVTMGGSPVSVSGGNINISNVTGDIVITAVAEESAVIPTYTNLAEPDAESTGEEAWNNGGWCNDSYMAGTSYAYRYGTGRITTNKFAVEYGDTIYVKGINYTEDSTLQIAIFDVNGEYIKHGSAYNMHINQGMLKSLTGTVGEDYWHFKNEAKTDSADCGTRFIRIAGAPSGSVSDIIITRNQEIV